MKHPIVALLFGGKSPEYEVSCRSAAALRDALLNTGYEVLPIGITREGVWYLFRGSPDRIWEAAYEHYDIGSIFAFIKSSGIADLLANIGL